MKSVQLLLVACFLLYSEQVYSQDSLQVSTKVIIEDGYDHAELTVTPWGGSHGLFFGSRIKYNGAGDLWSNNNAVYAQSAGQYNYGAFSMGYVANGGLFGFWDGGLSTGAGNAINWKPVMSFIRGGNVGIGTINPGGKLEINHAGGQLKLSGGTVDAGLWTSASDVLYLADWQTGTKGLYVNLSSGNIGIGTTNPGLYKLAVEGKIGARKVVVTQNAWADYVFDPTYKLPTLQEVEYFIKKNKHLPDVPSAKEVAANGLDLGDNQAVLLKKIEELVLYIIEQEKEINRLKEGDKRFEDLQQQINELQKQIKKN